MSVNQYSFVSQDMLPFKDVILKLRHQHMNVNLSREISAQIGSEPHINIFLIKMEIYKLARETGCILDFRAYFKDSCKPIEIGGVIHYLDDKSERLLKAEYKSYGNKLTTGAIGIVTQEAKLRHRDSPITTRFENIPEVELLSLSRYYIRKEERLYFTKRVKVYNQDPTQLTKEEKELQGINGVTSNISLSGISIRFEKSNFHHFETDVYVHIFELEREFVFKNKPIIPYEIIKTIEKKDDIYLMLNIKEEQGNPSIEEFSLFVKNLILTDRRKYRISAENIEKAVSIKCNEQFVLGKIDSLPVFYTRNDNEWSPLAQLSTYNNGHVAKFNKERDNQYFISALSKMTNIQKLLDRPHSFSDYLFTFPVKDAVNSTFYVSIPYNKLIENQLFIEKAKLAWSKGRLKLYRIEGSVLDPETQSYIPSSIPETMLKQQNSNIKAARQVQNFVDQLSRMIVISDITDVVDSLQIFIRPCPQSSKILPGTPLDLKLFSLHIPKTRPKILGAISDSHSFRSEDRFDHTLDVEVRLNKSDQVSVIHGHTENISTQGLRIKLQSPVLYKVSDIVLVSIPKLTKNGEVLFKNQPYTIVSNQHGLILGLNILGRPKGHIGRRVLQQYIYRNLSDITKKQGNTEIQGLSRSLRNLFTYHVKSNYAIIAKKDSTRYVRSLLCSESSGYIELYPEDSNSITELLRSDIVRSEVLKRGATTNKYRAYDVFHVIVLSRPNNSQSLLVKVIEKMSKDSDLSVIREKLGRLGELKILRVKVANKAHVFNQYYEAELRYLIRYAPANAMRINQQEKETINIVELSDVSDLAGIPQPI